MSVEELLEPVNASSAGRDPRRVGYELDRGENVSRGARGVVDRRLQRRHAMDSPRVHPGAGGEQDLDKLDAVKARGEVERTVEVAAAFDQQIDARAVDAELVTQRGPEHVGLGDLAEQRPAGAHLDMHQLGL